MSTVFPESPLGSPACRETGHVGSMESLTPGGYRGPAAHAFTPACAGFHPPSEPCPGSSAPAPLPAETTSEDIGDAAHAGYCGDGPRPDWNELGLDEQLRWIRAGVRAATRAYRSLVAERDHLRAELRAHAEAIMKLNDELAARDGADGGRWERISFMGHLEYAGWVTEVTRNGQAAYRIELPGYLWGDDKSAWVEHSAASWFSSNPVNDRALRRDWEARRRRSAEIAEWEARQKARALPAAEDDDEDDPYTEAGRDYQRAEMAREDERGHDHDDDGDDGDEEPF